MAFSAPKLPTAKGFNFRKLAKYANPESLKDLDVFLDNLPVRAGMNGIIVASIIWAIAGASLLVSYSKSVNLKELHKELTESQASLPKVPVISYSPISEALIRPHIARMKDVYKNLTIEITGTDVKIAAASTRDFAAWRAAIGDVSYGGNGWRVQLKEMCAGRDCQGVPLQAILSVQQLDIKIPDTKTES